MTREEAIRDIEECVLPHVGGISLRMAIEDMKEMDRLSKAEPVLKEPDRPHGEWKRISMDKYIRHASCFYRCSVCGEDTIGETNFCPNCGADMREGEAE